MSQDAPDPSQSRAGVTNSPASGSSSPAGEPDRNVDRDIELLLSRAEEAVRSVNAPAPAPSRATPFTLRTFEGSTPTGEKTTLELLRDVELDLRIELGRTIMPLEDVLSLRKGAVVPLDKMAGDPVDIFVNGRLIARGEVLVLNENFCVRVADLVSSEGAA